MYFYAYMNFLIVCAKERLEIYVAHNQIFQDTILYKYIAIEFSKNRFRRGTDI